MSNPNRDFRLEMKAVTLSRRHLRFLLHNSIAVLSSGTQASYSTNSHTKFSRSGSKLACQVVRRTRFLSYSTSPAYSYNYGDSRTTIVKALTNPIFHINKRKWGCVIVRGSYTDDKAWHSAMTKISYQVLNSLEDTEQEQNVYSLYEQTVLENPSILTNVDKASLRPHFEKWVRADLAKSINTQVLCERYPDRTYNTVPPTQITDSILPQYILESTRHSHFIYINDLCLQSFKTNEPVVILIQKDYEAPGYPNFDEEFDPIEGNPHYDIGWHYMLLSRYLERYRELADPCGEEYRWSWARPPWLSLGPCISPDLFGPELNKEGTGPAVADR